MVQDALRGKAAIPLKYVVGAKINLKPSFFEQEDTFRKIGAIREITKLTKRMREELSLKDIYNIQTESIEKILRIFRD